VAALLSEILDRLEQSPVIAAVGDDKWHAALESPAQVLFYLSAELMTVDARVREAHEAGKRVMIHLDLAEGIGRDRAGIRYLKRCGADGILSTRAQLIRLAREQELITVQRFFALDSKGMDSIIGKAIRRFSTGKIPVIAGGLIQTKGEVTDALSCGAAAVSTGQRELWSL